MKRWMNQARSLAAFASSAPDEFYWFGVNAHEGEFGTNSTTRVGVYRGHVVELIWWLGPRKDSRFQWSIHSTSRGGRIYSEGRARRKSTAIRIMRSIVDALNDDETKDSNRRGQA